MCGAGRRRATCLAPTCTKPGRGEKRIPTSAYNSTAQKKGKATFAHRSKIGYSCYCAYALAGQESLAALSLGERTLALFLLLVCRGKRNLAPAAFGCIMKAMLS